MPLARRLLPFLIEHLPDDASRMERFRAEAALGNHPLGARRLRGVTMAVRDLASAERVYADELGLRTGGYEENPALRASTAWLPLGPDVVVLAAPTSPESPLADELNRRGEGLFSIEVEVEDLDRAVEHLTLAGFGVQHTGVGRTVMLDPEQIHGGRIALSQG